MQNISEYLANLSDKLDAAGKTVCADSVDKLLKNKSAVKVAQYVGAIGYVLKQNRAMCNCVRQKRVTSNAAMQEVIFECLKEYQDGQSYGNNEWTEKYASVVKLAPDSFDNAHLYLIAEIAAHNNIQSHIDDLEVTAALLNENNSSDPFIDTLLSDLGSYGEILKGDQNSRPFKLAAPQSPRSRWNRFFSRALPWQWGKAGRERGEDKDTMIEMDNVLENIMSITTRAQQIRTGIYRLQNQVYGYLAGSGQDLGTTNQPMMENANIIPVVVRKIQELDDTNWNKSVLAIQQMQHLLSEQTPRNSYNNQALTLAKELCDNMAGSINEVYKNIQQIQTNMQTLRQRAPVKGREVGGIVSPAEEFGALEQVLNKLYENPFDAKAHYYAQKMHSRLDDRLRSIKLDPDQETTNWLQTNNRPAAPSQNEFVSPQQSASQPQNIAVNDNQVEQSVRDIMDVDIPGLENPSEKATALWLLMGVLANSSLPMDANTKGAINKLRNSLDLIRRKQTNPQSVAPGAAPSVSQTASADFMPHIPNIDEDEDRDVDGVYPTASRNISRNDVIKIADALDKTSPSVVDVIDQYIKEHKDDVIVLPKIPENSELIKETV